MKIFKFITSALTAAVLLTGCEFITVIPPEGETVPQSAANPVEAEPAPEYEEPREFYEDDKPEAVDEAPENEYAPEDNGEAPAEDIPEDNGCTETYVEYHFRSKKQLEQHFEKHGGEFGEEFGYYTAEDYEKGACDVINDPTALYKTEAEDGDGVYYIVDTNEFVILSTDGYIRTYFRPSAGIDYYNRQ